MKILKEKAISAHLTGSKQANEPGIKVMKLLSLV